MSGECLVLYDDKSDDVTFSGPAWQSGALLTNMQDPRVTKVARSVDATAANTQFFMALSTAITIPGVILVGTNLTVDAQYRITAYSDSGFSVQTFTTGLMDVFPGVSELVDPDFKGVPLIALFGEDVTAAYWQVEIIDTANPDTYVELGKLFLGKALTVTTNFAEGGAFSRDPNTLVQSAINRTPYYSRHKNIRTWTLQFAQETYANAWDQIDRMVEKSGLDRPVFIIPFPDDPARYVQQAFLGRLSKPGELKMLLTARASTDLQVTEYNG